MVFPLIFRKRPKVVSSTQAVEERLEVRSRLVLKQH
jgi:hypothetical protein